MWLAFALQKLLTFFQQKISAYLRITWCFNESLTNDVVSFEQLGLDCQLQTWITFTYRLPTLNLNNVYIHLVNFNLKWT